MSSATAIQLEFHWDESVQPQPWAPPHSPAWAKWLRDELASMGWKRGRVTYLFASDEVILEMNRTHLQHDYFTDILTFDQSHKPVLEVDLAISIERIADHARDRSIPAADELARVLIHGLLHVSGWDDHTDSDRTAMRHAEDLALQRRPAELLGNA